MFVTQWLRLQRTQWYDRKHLKDLQLKALRSIVRYAYLNVPLYRRLYRSSTANPLNLQSLEDLRKLPVIAKDTFRSTPIRERLSEEFSPSDCFVRRTSGSTGEPLELLEEPAVYNFMRGYQLRRLLSYGFRPWETVATLDPRRVDKPTKARVFNPLSTRLFRSGIRNVPMNANPRAARIT